MAVLDNSARKILRATYTPLKRPAASPPLQQAWAKVAFAASLQVNADEFERLAGRPDLSAAVLPAVRATIDRRRRGPSETASLFADVPWNDLLQVGDELQEIRQAELADFRDTYATIIAARRMRPASDEEDVSSDRDEQGRDLPMAARGEPGRALSTTTLRARGSAAEPNLRESLDWAVEHGIQAATAQSFMRRLAAVDPGHNLQTMAAYESSALAHLAQTDGAVAGAKQQAQMSPVGLLHLERLSFVPAGIERGELVASVPLSPGEEVNISHKEWTTTSEEFSRIVTDFMEAYSEEGVSEKLDIAQSTTSQEQHSSGFNMGVTASGGYGPVNITTSVNYNANESASLSEQASRNASSTLTRKASSRAKKEHKTSFKVASAAGTEDQQIRKIKNPFPDKATRIDYYQMMRKWQVDLHRYGIRLTYDIMIPEPGVGILSKVVELNAITAALGQGFGDPDATEPSAMFNLLPSEIERDNWSDLIAQYGVSLDGLDPPPQTQMKPKVRYQALAYSYNNAYKLIRFLGIEFDTHDGYIVVAVTKPKVETYPPQNIPPPVQSPIFEFITDLGDWKGKSGKLEAIFKTGYILSFYLEVWVTTELTPEAFRAWQMKVWTACRDAARERYEEHRQYLKQRLSSLLEEVGGLDALTLRRIEREEVMKGVLRWMFGPGFEFAPDDELFGFSKSAIGAADVPGQLGGGWWEAYWTLAMDSIRAKQEEIRFLHHAIEWENMLYILYPYFWSSPDRWELKKYLRHPDAMHEIFLRSGSARVVLTIRPGFEQAFLAFMETGNTDGEHDYLTIAQEMEAFAKTNYPGIRAANPVEGARPLLTVRQRKAWEEMQHIMQKLDEYRDDHQGTYPTTAQGLAALGASVPKKDPWGHAYVYTSPGLYSQYDLASLGKDGQPDDADGEPSDDDEDEEDADITSWAEASLIGRWHEYTPTSALDIAFGDTTPTA